MPMYDHVCSCGQTLAEYRPLAEWNKLPLCPDCGQPMPQCFVRVAVRGDYKKPCELQSMGFIAVPEDVAEHRRRFPDVDLRFDNGSAIPVVRSLCQKRKYLKQMNWVDVKSFT